MKKLLFYSATLLTFALAAKDYGFAQKRAFELAEVATGDSISKSYSHSKSQDVTQSATPVKKHLALLNSADGAALYANQQAAAAPPPPRAPNQVRKAR